jgi:tRNA (guanine37-N1)-methyltransferase
VVERVTRQPFDPSLSKGLDVVGDIAIIKLPEDLIPIASKIGETILEEAPYIKVVLKQTTPISGEYRIRELKWLAGEKRTTTIHKEYGCQYKVDLKTAYFSPRLAYERMRIAKLVRLEFDLKGKQEVITNLFAGVGCFSIIIAKHSPTSKIYSIDINPNAVNMMNDNVLLNKVVEQVIPILGDASEVVKLKLKGKSDRVLMPLPERAIEFLDDAINTLKPNGGCIHFQDFVYAGSSKDPIEESTKKLIMGIENFNQDFEILNARVIRDVGPNWFHVGLDVAITNE